MINDKLISHHLLFLCLLTSVLVGASSTEQLAKNLKCVSAELFTGDL